MSSVMYDCSMGRKDRIDYIGPGHEIEDAYGIVVGYTLATPQIEQLQRTALDSQHLNQPFHESL